MIRCPACTTEQSDESKFCSECGVALRPEYEATVTHSSAQSSSASSLQSSASLSSQHGRFLPGTKVADRYRIVSLVGQGGMGEVYRADDLKLGHTVALKFLPKDFGDDPQRLEYFLSEVRLTRQISHPNVCRVYDIGEANGLHFLSMEFIDGEDLRMLLRRIGRLPQEKGIQVAQQICAGLAAAHEQRVLHRDLKPANIMLDGRGQVRITDFGLAKIAGEGADGEIAGTPAYMAPEQLSHGQATIQSDLYSLGLILYELFTGEPARSTGSIPELIRLNEESALSGTLELPDDIDPAVRRAIARCLEKLPHDRPPSVHAVAASLPGGDPLAAALAAGETPSPEMVAAAGDKGLLSLRTASILVAIVLVELIALIPLRGSSSPARELEYHAETYAAEARKILSDLHISDQANGKPSPTQVYGFTLDQFPLDDRYKQIVLDFWYRDSDEPLSPRYELRSRETYTHQMIVSSDNPSPLTDGTVSMKLNLKRELRELLVRPSTETSQQEPLSADDLDAALLKAANLISDKDSKLISESYTVADQDPWTPPLYAESDGIRVYVPKLEGRAPVSRIEIATNEGQLVYFRAVENRPEVPKDPWKEFREDKRGFVLLVGNLIRFLAMILAWRHAVQGKVDWRSAWRVAMLIFSLEFLRVRLEAGFTLAWVHDSLTIAAGAAFIIWIYYLAIEPLARRFWPTILTDWMRAVSGRCNDASLGRGILIGTACGVLITLLMELLHTPYVSPYSAQSLSGLRFQFSEAIGILKLPVFFGTYVIIFLVLFRVLFRKDWLAAVLTIALMLFFFHDETILQPSTFTILATLYYGLISTLLIKFGVAAPVSMMFCHHFSERFFISNDWIGPDVSTTTFVIITILTLTGYGFYTSVGGRPYFARLITDKP